MDIAKVYEVYDENVGGVQCNSNFNNFHTQFCLM